MGYNTEIIVKDIGREGLVENNFRGLVSTLDCFDCSTNMSRSRKGAEILTN